MDVDVIVMAILSSSVLVALINAITAVWTWKANKKAKDEDKKDDLEERVKNIEECRDNISKNIIGLSDKLDEAMKNQAKLAEDIKYSNQLLMRDRIKSLAQDYLKRETISFEDRKLIHDMWDTYHTIWGGNGDLNLLMEAIDELQLEVK